MARGTLEPCLSTIEQWVCHCAPPHPLARLSLRCRPPMLENWTILLTPDDAWSIPPPRHLADLRGKPSLWPRPHGARIARGPHKRAIRLHEHSSLGRGAPHG